jgi:hypothetical protein
MPTPDPLGETNGDEWIQELRVPIKVSQRALSAAVCRKLAAAASSATGSAPAWLDKAPKTTNWFVRLPKIRVIRGYRQRISTVTLTQMLRTNLCCTCRNGGDKADEIVYELTLCGEAIGSDVSQDNINMNRHPDLPEELCEAGGLDLEFWRRRRNERVALFILLYALLILLYALVGCLECRFTAGEEATLRCWVRGGRRGGRADNGRRPRAFLVDVFVRRHGRP